MTMLLQPIHTKRNIDILKLQENPNISPKPLEPKILEIIPKPSPFILANTQ